MSNQRFQIQFDFQANLGPVKTQVEALQKTLTGINLPPNLAANFEKLFGKLDSEMADFQAMTKNGFTNMADVSKAQTAFTRISKLINQINGEAARVKGIDPNKLIPKDAQTRVDGLRKKLGELQAQQNKKDGFAEEIKKQNDLIKKQETAINGLKSKRNALAKENTQLGAAKSAQSKQKSAAETDQKAVLGKMKALEGTKGGKSTAEYKALSQELTRLGNVIKSCDNEMSRLTTQINKNKSSMGSLDGEIGQSETALTGLKSKLSEMQAVDVSPQGLLELRQELAKLMNVNLDEIPNDLTAIQNAINGLNDGEITQVNQRIQQMDTNLDNIEGSANNAKKGMNNLVTSAQGLNQAAQDMENFKNQVMYFFSMTNSVQLFKRAVTGALNTVKELDKTMTEAAVVTDFTVGDMWEKLPEYSANAQKLGVSINEMYQATTLYYQQGLKTNEAMALGVETMEMARIASMSSAEATQAMTAALRGFNMELNEASATKVNDVYSQLAAITAADTSQIATAMEKTASIAASANMEFETTAALLAQIIETTQEAPETAGTAMKTIIARFSEVKSLRNQGQTSGKDSEGEDIDVNKIQTALGTVGISMEGFFAGTEGLDQVLLKLAEKWDTLDFKTQRYIATTAAGSRQQSRFIAMMSDYARTTELVGEAQNSTGASQRQFEKTQDSMETKLRKLQNAWEEFLMGLSNNEVLKGAIDVLTFIIEGVNKLTDALSGGNGLIKSIVSLITVVGALKLGKSMLGGLLGGGLSWAGQKMGIGGQNQPQRGGAPIGTDGTTPGQTNQANQPNPMPNAQNAGNQAGTNWGTGFLASVIKKLDAGRHTVEQKAESMAGQDEGQAAGNKFAGVSEKTRNRHEGKAQKNLKKQYGGTGRARKGGNQEHVAQSRKGFLQDVAKRNEGVEGFDMDQVQKEFDETYQKTQDLGKSMDAASQKTRDLGGTMMNSAEQTEMMNDKSAGLSSALSGAGQAAMAAGMAINLLGSLFESLGMEDAAEACNWIGTALIGVGSALMMLPGLISGVASVATAAGISVQAAWWWLLIIVVVIIAIIALVYVLCKAFEAASESAQLEKMNEQLEELSAAADEAKQKLEDMAKAKEELEDLGNAFDGLVKGSKEWKQALIENNQKVLDLLNTYPQLAKFVEKGLNGELTIKEEGWDAMMDQQQMAYTNAQSAKTAQMQSIKEKEQYIAMENAQAKANGKGGLKDYADFVDTGWGKAAMIGGGAAVGAGIGAAVGSIVPVIGTAIGAAVGGIVGAIGGIVQAIDPPDPEDVERQQTGGLTYDEMTNFASLAAERGLSMADGSLDKEAAQELLNELGYSVESIDDFMASVNNLGTTFDELANSAYAATEAERARVDAIASQVAQTSDIVQQSEDFGTVAEEMGSQAYENYNDRVNSKSSEYADALDDKGLDSEEATSAVNKYAEMNGLTADEVRKKVEDGELSTDTIAKTLAAEDINKEMKTSMENTVKIMEKVAVGKSKKEVATMKGLMTDRGLGMSIDSIQAVNGQNMSDYLAKQFGGSPEEREQMAKDMGYETWGAYVKAMETNAKNAQAALDNAFSDKNTLGMGDELKGKINSLNSELMNLGSEAGLTVQQTQRLANALAKVTANGGDATALLNQFPDLLKGLSGSDLDSAIDLLSSTDWTQQSSIDSTMEGLKMLGAEIDDALVREVYLATKAVKKLDLSAMEEKLKNIKSVIDTVSEKQESGSKKYTKEERDSLIAQGIQSEQFVRIGIDEYAFMGDTNSLLEALNNKVSDILAEMQGDIDNAVEIGDKYSAAFSNSSKVYTVGDGKEGSTTGKTANAQTIVESLVNGGMDTLGVGGTNNVGRETLLALIKDLGLLDGEDLSTYSDQMLAEAITMGYKNYYGAGGRVLANNKETQNEYRTETQTATYASDAGTVDFMEYVKAGEDKADKYEGKTYTESVLDGSGMASAYVPHGYKVASYNQLEDETTWERTIKAEDVVNTVANDDGSRKGFEFTQSTERKVAADLGMADASTADIQAVDAFIKQYYEDTKMAETAIDGVIAANAGLGVAVENTAAQIGKQNAALGKDTIAMKNLAVAAFNSNKKMDLLNGTLADQAANLKIGNKNNALYRTALEKTADAAKAVFGDKVDSEFVEQNRALFEQLAQGGDVAEAAYGQIAAKYGEMVMLQETGFAKGSSAAQKAAQIMNSAFASVKPGESLDLSSYYAKLMAIEGMTHEAAMKTMNAWGFSISTTTKKAWMKGGIVSETKPADMTGWVEFDMVVGTKETAVGTGANAPSGGGGGGEYDNSYDKLHNTLEEINDAMREREKLERRYQRLIDQNLATAQELSKLSKANIGTYEYEIEKQQAIINGRKQQIEQEMAENPDLHKFVYTETGVDGKESIRINWEAFESLKKQKTGEKADEYYSNIQTWLQSIYDAETAIEDAQDAIYQEMLEGKDDFLKLEEQVKEAIINDRQKQIEKLTTINKSINDTNGEIIKAMQSSIEDYRQNRDNQKTEDDLSDKQRKLAYLQQDTSGANAKDILTLQKEIEDGQQSYTDQLIDQKISELQEQNDKASEQRQQQIDIMQAQLDKYSESKEIWSDVAALIESGTSNTEGLVKGSELETLLKSSSAFEGMSKIQQMDWLNQTNNQIAGALKWLSDGALKTTQKEGSKITFTNKDGQTVTGTVGKNGEVVTEDGSVYTDVDMDAYGNLTSSQSASDATAERDKRTEEEKKRQEEEEYKKRYPYGKPSEATRTLRKGDSGLDVKAVQHALKKMGYYTDEIDGRYGSNTKKAVLKFQAEAKKKGWNPEIGSPDGVVGPRTRVAFKNHPKQYKTGGLADFTGPAWLDGTKSKPEYVLNADQTKAFFHLVDVLGSLQTGSVKASQNSGDNTYDIDINVESIGSDYDVEQLANTVKRLINEDARYRNNNAINLMR